MPDASKKMIWPLIVQLPTLLAVPIVSLWGNTPASILHSGKAGSLLESVGTLGCGAVLLLAGPIGVIGLILTGRHAERMGNLRAVTKGLSVANIVFGSLSVGILALIFVFAAFFGASA